MICTWSRSGASVAFLWLAAIDLLLDSIQTLEYLERLNLRKNYLKDHCDRLLQAIGGKQHLISYVLTFMVVLLGLPAWTR